MIGTALDLVLGGLVSQLLQAVLVTQRPTFRIRNSEMRVFVISADRTNGQLGSTVLFISQMDPLDQRRLPSNIFENLWRIGAATIASFFSSVCS